MTGAQRELVRVSVDRVRRARLIIAQQEAREARDWYGRHRIPRWLSLSERTGRCAYCGYSTDFRGAACAAHADLLELDPLAPQRREQWRIR